MAEHSELKGVIEALLFASEKPLTPEQIKEAFDEDVPAADIRSALDELKSEYAAQARGFVMAEIAGGFQLVSEPRFSIYLKRFYQAREKKKLSQASLETLSVVAYKQPVTKADIEFIRGVNVDGPLRTLLEKGLVRIAGRKDVPGRPMLYATTKEFLEHFGLNAVKDLPALKEYTEKDIEQHLLPPELKEKAAEEAGDGEQKPVGCDNSETEEGK